MSDPEMKLTREELHNMVWTRPFVRLAKELGYSYLELVAICEDLNIPRPSGGYWGRLERGLAEDRVPLPPAPPGKPTQIQLGPRRGNADTTTDEPDAQTVLKDTKAESGAQEKSEAAQSGNDPSTGSAGDAKESDAVEKSVKAEYTREQLHEAIWSKPCVKLAAELGISDVALAKTCRRLGIPRPARGYWARVEAGEKIKREPLPAVKPGQNPQVTFYVAANVTRREEWAANNILTAAHMVKCGAVELPSEGSELHPIAEKHRHALEKAKPGELGFVTASGKALFDCDLSAALVPRLARAVHALVCELEDRDYEFKAGSSEYDGLQISRDRDEATLRWSEAMIELEREPTPADKRKPSWTWQLKETKPAGTLSIEISAFGLKGKRKWAEGDNRSLEEVLGVIVEKVEAVFRGYEDRRKREAAWAKQQEEEDKREAEAEAIEAEKQAREEKARKERERIKRHEKKLEEIAEHRSDNLASAAQEWVEMQGILAYVHFCEERWRREGGGTLSKEQADWLSWSRGSAEIMGLFAKGYPAPSLDGGFEASAVPVGGPYPETRKWESDEPEETKPPEIKPPAHEPPPLPAQFPFWLMHRRH
jgi:hypothetical protein